jgi:hypothetical protein
MDSPVLLDAIGRPRSPATLPGHFAGRPPRNKGRRYPADPPRVEEIVAVMRAAGPGVPGDRLRVLVAAAKRRIRPTTGTAGSRPERQPL